MSTISGTSTLSKRRSGDWRNTTTKPVFSQQPGPTPSPRRSCSSSKIASRSVTFDRSLFFHSYIYLQPMDSFHFSHPFLLPMVSSHFSPSILWPSARSHFIDSFLQSVLSSPLQDHEQSKDACHRDHHCVELGNVLISHRNDPRVLSPLVVPVVHDVRVV